jgi:hypothetical protein
MKQYLKIQFLPHRKHCHYYKEQSVNIVQRNNRYFFSESYSIGKYEVFSNVINIIYRKGVQIMTLLACFSSL